MVNLCSCFETVGLLESEEVLGHLAETIGSFLSLELDAFQQFWAYIETNRERCFGINLGACVFSVIRRVVLRWLLDVPQVSLTVG